MTRFSRADILSGKAAAESKIVKPEQTQGFYDKDADIEEPKSEPQKKKVEKARKSKVENKMHSLMRQIDRLEKQRNALDKKIQALQSTLTSMCDHKDTALDWTGMKHGSQVPHPRCTVCGTVLYR